jgi:preprotein translocase subunit SecE
MFVFVMHTEMWEYFVIVVNVAVFCVRGIVVVEFVVGWLIGKDIGLG